MLPIQALLVEHIDLWTAASSNKTSKRGRISADEKNIYGVSKLRELILQLAASGRLVSQEPSDIAVEEVLRREGHKEQLKRNENHSDECVSFNADMPYALPSNWKWVYLPDLANYGVGKTPSTKVSEYWCESGDNGFNWVSIGDLTDEGVVNSTAKKISHKASVNVFKSPPIPEGTLLMSFKLTLGKVSILDMPAYHNEAIISIFPKSFVLKEYLFRVLPSRARAGNSKSAIKGDTLNSKSLAKLLIPLPPLNEQLRIISKINELMLLCDSLESKNISATSENEKLAEELLAALVRSRNDSQFFATWENIFNCFDLIFTTQSSIDRLKHALIQLGLMGRLTSRNINDLPASELLKKLSYEKNKLISEGLLKKDKAVPEISEAEKMFPIPLGWEWARLQAVIDVRDGTHDSPRDSIDSDSYPLITSKDFSGGEINFSGAKRISAADHREIAKRSFVEKSDILFSMIGGNIGNQVMVNTDQPFSIKNVALFKYYNKELTNPLYIKKYTEFLAERLQDLAIGGAQPFVSLGQLRSLAIPLPPLQEQQRIVDCLDQLFVICEKIKERLVLANQLQRKISDVLVGQALA